MKSLIFLLFFPLVSFAQNDTSENARKPNAKEKIICFCAIDASFPGGHGALTRYISHFSHYPRESRENGDQGTVYVDFVVEKDGRITEVEIAKGVTPELDYQAYSLTISMPRWLPAEFECENVRTSMRLPITFSLL